MTIHSPHPKSPPSPGRHTGARRRIQLVAWLMAVIGLSALPPAPALAKVYRLIEPSDSVIGTPFYVKAKGEHTMLDIGRHHGLGVDEMKQANPDVDMWIPGDGTAVLVPDRHILPDSPRKGIVLNLAERRMYYYRSATEIETFSIGIGRDGWETPVGSYSIIEKTENPSWTPPASIRAEYAKNGKILPAVVPPGPDNPLGSHRLRLSNPSYLIHGTNKPWGVGMPVSSGCTRMFPEDIEYLFGQVEVGTPVTIVDQPYKVGWLGDQLFLEVSRAEGTAPSSAKEIIPASIANAEGVVIDWEAVSRVLRENTGLPQIVGGRQGSKSWHHFDMIF
ncbi:MAG: L,D-transpeptidase family protein [Lamprobacter sp.]|uniref:L,D-transpeptidase family protein n=1 Tax=Lamprobacter sp. TaxID=3100796 RepID=UPI002B259F27|nr:L,D-transpeptidase family protein [Lamprobacter sp.]MEA3639028.1 L,D-transpeptidase family protein [Lamprobacter sp.]